MASLDQVSRSGMFAIPLAVLLITFAVAFSLLPPAAAAQTTVNVNIHSYAFSPSTITVVIGVNNTVTWTNNDPVTHTVTADDSSFNKTLPSGGTFTRTFTTAGTFAYHCAIHTYMKGTVNVLNPPSSGGSTTSNSSGIPEFPFEGIALIVTTAVVLVSYVAVRQTRRK